jgi:hypothetical protein
MFGLVYGLAPANWQNAGFVRTVGSALTDQRGKVLLLRSEIGQSQVLSFAPHIVALICPLPSHR